MDKILSSVARVLEKATFGRVLAVGLLILFGVLGYIGYSQSTNIGQIVFNKDDINQFVNLPPISQQAVELFMKKHKSVVYLTVLTFKFEKNIRLPIYRSFNSNELKSIIYTRLDGGDGALPIFIKNDQSNNNQMISIITGEITCDPFTGGGLARVWPDLEKRLTMSCRVPIPPSFGDLIQGYMVAHVAQPLTPYEVEVLKLDLILLAKTLHSNNHN